MSKTELSAELQHIVDKLAVAESEIKIYELRGVALYAKQKALQEELRNACPHPKEYLKAEYSYFSGSYYDRASTDHWTTCTLCGAKSEIRTETHSYYG